MLSCQMYHFSFACSWLQCLDLSQYACVFQDHGIHQLSQVIDLTDDVSEMGYINR